MPHHLFTGIKTLKNKKEFYDRLRSKIDTVKSPESFIKRRFKEGLLITFSTLSN